MLLFLLTVRWEGVEDTLYRVHFRNEIGGVERTVKIKADDDSQIKSESILGPQGLR